MKKPKEFLYKVIRKRLEIQEIFVESPKKIKAIKKARRNQDNFSESYIGDWWYEAECLDEKAPYEENIDDPVKIEEIFLKNFNKIK